jgi:DNA-binding PadR family transcriptional regulator
MIASLLAPLRVVDLFYNVLHMTVPSLGDFELSVLATIARLGDGAYGLRIRKEVSALRRHDYSVGAVYTALQRLEEKRVIASQTTAPLPVRGGRSRREYHVTATGKRALRDAKQLAARLWAFDPGPSPA